MDEVILGQVLTAAQGQNPARQAARAAGIPDSKTAFGINQVCGSGLRAVALAAQQIRTGESDIVVAGGQESMSQSAPCRLSARRHQDGRCQLHRHDDQGRAVGRLQRLSHGHHRRERRAKECQITRADQDALALASQQKASAAQKAGKFKDEIAPVTLNTRKGEVVVTEDEYIRARYLGRGHGEAAPGLHQGRHGDRRQCLGHQ